MPDPASEDRDRFRVSPTEVPPVRRTPPHPDPSETAVVSSGARQVALPGTTEQLSRVPRDPRRRPALPRGTRAGRPRPPGRTPVGADPGDEPVDADRWLYVHEDEVIGAMSEAAVELVADAGLTPQVDRYQGVAPEAGPADVGRVRLFIGDDGKVRRALSG